jgi:tetratricopeptide (TPR) repeat protein
MTFWRQEVAQPMLDRDVEASIAEQRAILERDPQNARAHFALGTLAYFRGHSAAAIKYFRKAIELDPACAASHVSLGRMYAVEGDYDLAWRHAREAERLGDRSLVGQLERYPNATRLPQE